MADITWDPAHKGNNVVLSNGNLTMRINNTSNESARATISKGGAKWYWEVKIDIAPYYHWAGVGTSSASVSQCPGENAYSYGYRNNGEKYHSGSGSSYGDVFTVNDVIGTALDVDAGKIWFSKNGVWQASGNPVTGANPAFSSLPSSLFPMHGVLGGGDSATARFGHTSFSYTPPTGFVSLQTVYYLSGVVKVEDVFAARKVNVYNQTTGVLVGSTTSSGVTGEWTVAVGTYSYKYFAVCVPDSTSRNAEIFANLDVAVSQ